MATIWEDWEAWFRLLIETHTRAPVLAVVPSVHRGQSWLVAAVAILDTASFRLSTLDAKDNASATLCYATGVNALKLIAAKRRATPARAAIDLSTKPFSFAAFAAFCDQTAALGAPVKGDIHRAWRSFTTFRHEYEDLLPSLARGLLVPLDNSLLLPVVD